MFELGDQLLHLGLGLADLGVLQERVGLAHLIEDLFLARELQGQPKPRGVFRFEASKRLGKPEHPLFQLGHLNGGVFLGEADGVAVGDRRGFRLVLLVLVLVLGVLVVVEEGVGLRGLRSRGSRSESAGDEQQEGERAGEDAALPERNGWEIASLFSPLRLDPTLGTPTK